MAAESSNPPIEELLRHADWVRGLARRLVADADAADDLVQETWLAALRRPPEGGVPPRSWLAGVVANVARMRRRSERHRADREAAVRDDAPPTGDELAARVDAQRVLVEEALALEDPLRERLFERWFEGLSAAEIARRRGLPAGTVRWQLKCAVDLLRERLDRRHGGERRAWIALLLPLGRDLRPGPAPASLSLWNGVLAMSTASKLVAGGALAAALAVGLSLLGVLPVPRLSGAAPEQPVRVAYRPLAPAGAPPAELAPVDGGAAPRRNAAAQAATPRAAASEAGASDVVRLRGRVLDELGRPIAGARVAAVGGTVAGRRLAAPLDERTDARGELDASFALAPRDPGERGRSADTLVVEASAPGRARERQAVGLRAGETVWLEDFRLAPAGVVSGRVLAPDRSAVAGATVAVLEPSLEGFRGMLRAGGDERGAVVERMWFDHATSGAPRATTDAAGRFSVDDAPAGPRRLAATAPGRLTAFSATFDVRAGEEAHGLELVLAAFPAANRVAGRVTDPDGRPFGGAVLRFESEDGSGSRGTGPDGAFELAVRARAACRLDATDPEGRFGPASVVAAGGDLDVELRLARLAELVLVVRARGGEPVERFAARVVAAEAAGAGDEPATLSELALAEHAGGRAVLRAPEGLFRVEVRAPGYALASTGPQSGRADRAEVAVTVTLDPLPGVHGVVVDASGPRAGVEVVLHADPERRMERNGFPVRFDAEEIERATTGPDGGFALTPRSAGRLVLVAEVDGRVAGELELADYRPEVGAAGLVLTLPEPGAIEGRVASAAGLDVTGRIVAVSRGDGRARSARVGPDGAYRIEGLLSGPWQVRVVEEELESAGVHTRNWASAEPDIEWDCDVRPGRTTRHDLWLDEPPGSELAGELTVDGEPAVGWTATLLVPGERSMEGPPVALDAEGRFTLAVRESGERRLFLTPPGAEGGRLRLVDTVELHGGRVEWRLALETGTLEGTISAAYRGPETSLIGRWAGEGARSALVAIQPDETGAFRVLGCPAGRVELVPLSVEVLEDPAALVPLAEATVPAGGVARVEL